MTQIRLSVVSDRGSARRQNAPSLVHELYFFPQMRFWRWEWGGGQQGGQLGGGGSRPGERGAVYGRGEVGLTAAG